MAVAKQGARRAHSISGQVGLVEDRRAISVNRGFTMNLRDFGGTGKESDGIHSVLCLRNDLR
jgi:hypothetical protein